MTDFFCWFFLLAAASPLLAKSIAPMPDHQEDVMEAGELLVTGTSRSSTSSVAERYLQIAHKNCQGPQGQPGTCMFNFECQQQRGQVVGACLDGFLFGACCHSSADQSMSAAIASTLQAVGTLTNQTDTSQTDLSATVGLNRTIIAGSSDLRAPSSTAEKVTTEEVEAQQLPLVLMFRNDSKVANKLAMTTGKAEEDASEPTRSKVSQSPWSGGVSLPITALPDNQISSAEAMPTTVGSVVLNKDDPDLQAQLTALLNAHTESSLTPITTRPIRKRPRPKPTTTTTTTTTTTSTTPAVEMTTTSPADFVTESLADQQANVLQFLVSNPPAWVLDEIINGSTLTTWYPLPISEETPDGQMNHSEEVSSTTTSLTVATSTTSRPPKRKPAKTRPQSANNKISSTTTETVNEDQRDLTTSTTTTSTTTTTTTTEETTTSATTTRKPRPVLDYTKDCGVRPMAPEARIVGGRRADYGKWPWQVLIRESTWFGIFSKNKCGGVLISDRHVLTAAHCQPGFLGSLLVVLGEFDLTGHSEPNTPVEKNVKRVVVHRDYVERTFENDLAILELESPVEFRPYIVPICLPSTSEGDFVGQKAEVTGWGKLSHNGPTPGVLYEVDVPIMSNPECHDMFKKAGHEKRILDSFVCAGYAEGKKDSCEGDSGGPLMLERDDGRWSLVGTVSHGIRCAYPNMPGVYMRMTYYRPWIERVTGIGGAQLGR